MCSLTSASLPAKPPQERSTRPARTWTDPRVALEAAARCGQHLGFARGAAAELSPALEDDGAAPAVGRHDRSGEAANARSHHQQVTFLLPGASGHARP